MREYMNRSGICRCSVCNVPIYIHLYVFFVDKLKTKTPLTCSKLAGLIHTIPEEVRRSDSGDHKLCIYFKKHT